MIQSHFWVWSNSKTPNSLLTSHALLFCFKIDPLLLFAIHVLLIPCPHFLGFLLRVSQIGFHKEFPNSNKFRVCPPLPFSPTHRLFLKLTLNLSIFCHSPFHSYLGQSASRMCVEHFVTHLGWIPPAFHITSQTLVSLVFFDLVSHILLSRPWLLLKPYSPSSSTLSPRLLMHTLSSTFNMATPFAPPPFPHPLPTSRKRVCRRDSVPTQSLPPRLHHPSPQFMCLNPTCLYTLPLCAHAEGHRRDSTPTPSPLHPGYANPIPQFMHPTLPCMHALPLCCRRDSALASPLRQAMQTPPPGLRPHPAHMPTHSPLHPDYSMATPPVYTPHPPTCPLPLHASQGCRRTGGTCAKGRVTHKGRGHMG